MEKEKYAKETLLAQIAGGAKLYAAASYATFPEKEKHTKETLLAWFGGGADLLTLPAPLCSPADAIHARGKKANLSAGAFRFSAPLCKGSCHGSAVTEGLTVDAKRFVRRPSAPYSQPLRATFVAHLPLHRGGKGCEACRRSRRAGKRHDPAVTEGLTVNAKRFVRRPSAPAKQPLRATFVAHLPLHRGGKGCEACRRYRRAGKRHDPAVTEGLTVDAKRFVRRPSAPYSQPLRATFVAHLPLHRGGKGCEACRRYRRAGNSETH